MTTITLFDAAQAVREALATVDPETGEYTDAYTASRELFEGKGGACVAYAVEQSHTIKARKAMVKAMADVVARDEARLERFEAYLADCMKATGISKVSADGLATATLYIGRDESVEIEDGAEFPLDLCSAPKPPAPSKTLIKAAILAGQPVAGARIVRRDRLTIR